MKKRLYISIALLVFSSMLKAQNIGDLNGIYYQAVAIDDEGKEIVGMDINGKPLYEKEIGVRFTITKNQDGDIEYQEEHSVLTDKYGLFSVVIGHGTQTGDGQYSDLLSMPWIDADQWLKVEIAIKNDGNYKLVSNQQFMTVPYSFYTDDIADNAIRTEKILNETILAEDIATGSVETSEILDSTISNQDIKTSAIDSRTILDEDIQASDIDTGAVTSSEIQNQTIVNEDIANGTINLRTKVTDTLRVANGGTGRGEVDMNCILVGKGDNMLDTLTVIDSVMVFSKRNGKAELYKLRAGLRASLEIDPATKTIYLHAVDQGGGPAKGGGTVSTGNIPAGGQQIRNFPADVAVGDIVLVTANVDLQGITMTAYVRQDGQVNVVLFNGTAQPINLGSVEFKIANFGQ